ncbi:SpoIIE family protein phosphatase [Kineococcus sp. SYSU DK005]|uniref:SpoIIE family protein phosphatase n=1 Tax=Kineococcus sp. SYSU DK005 TaxID=3383126 RepID=UPI003D7CC626
MEEPVALAVAPLERRATLDLADLRLLERTTARLAAALSVGAAVRVVLGAVQEALRATTCGVFLLEPAADGGADGGAGAGGVLVPAGDGVVLPRAAGRAPRLPLSASTPSAEAARTRRPVLLRSPAELAARFDDPVNERLVAAGERSWAALPMLTDTGLTGVLRLGLPREGSLDEVQLLLAATLAGQCACAVERAHLFDAVRAAERDARAAEHRYRTLARAGRLDVFTAAPPRGLTADLPGWRALTGRDGDVLGAGWTADVHPEDLPAVLAEAAAALREGRAAGARLRLRTPRGWRWLAARAQPVRADPDEPDSPVVEWVGALDDVDERVRSRRRTAHLQSLTAALSTATTRAGVVDAVLASCLELPGATRASLTLLEPERGPGGAVAVHRLHRDGRREHLVRDDRRAAELQRDVAECAAAGGWYAVGPAGGDVLPAWVRPTYREALAEGDARWSVLPLATPRSCLGGLVLGAEDEVAPDADERASLHALARQVADALERVDLLERELGTARVLQRALQPGPLPAVPWLAAHRATATSAGEGVGGDWAEVLVVDGERVAVVLGDVMGRGARAATVMGEVRAQVRALALVDPHPAAVLRGLDACAAAAGGEDLVTLAYVLLHRDGTALAALAGHPPPLLRGAGGARFLDAPAGPPVGAVLPGDAAARGDALRLHLGDGEDLVLFSDGLVESRERPLEQGLEEAREHLAGAGARTGGQPPSPARLVDGLLAALAGCAPVDDDVTVLAVRRLGGDGRAHVL